MKQNIFDPLGMADSGYDSHALIPHRAAGYRTGGRGLRNANTIDMRLPHAAGGLYATTGDMLKWTRALFGGKLLLPAPGWASATASVWCCYHHRNGEQGAVRGA